MPLIPPSVPPNFRFDVAGSCESILAAGYCTGIAFDLRRFCVVHQSIFSCVGSPKVVVLVPVLGIHMLIALDTADRLLVVDNHGLAPLEGLTSVPEAIQWIVNLGPKLRPIGGFCLLLGLAIRYEWRRNGARGLDLLLNWTVFRVFICGLLVLPPWYYYLYRYQGLPKPFDNREIGILIGEVPGDSDGQQQVAYAQAIRSLVDKSPDLNGIVIVRTLQRSLARDPEEQQEEAIRIGHWLGASFVVRPFAVEGVQEPWLTVIDQPYFPAKETPMGRFDNIQLARPDNLALPGDLLLFARSTLAFSYYRLGFYGQATDELQQVLSSPGLEDAILAPSRANLELTLGNTEVATGNLDGAIENFNKAINLEPDFAFAHSNLGGSLIAKGQYDAAIVHLEKAIKLKPQVAAAHINLGGAFVEKSQFTAAIAELKYGAGPFTQFL